MKNELRSVPLWGTFNERYNMLFKIFREPKGFTATILDETDSSLAQKFFGNINKEYYRGESCYSQRWRGDVTIIDNSVRYVIHLYFTEKKGIQGHKPKIDVSYSFDIYDRWASYNIGFIRESDIASQEVLDRFQSAFKHFLELKDNHYKKVVEAKDIEKRKVIEKYR